MKGGSETERELETNEIEGPRDGEKKKRGEERKRFFSNFPYRVFLFTELEQEYQSSIAFLARQIIQGPNVKPWETNKRTFSTVFAKVSSRFFSSSFLLAIVGRVSETTKKKVHEEQTHERGERTEPLLGKTFSSNVEFPPKIPSSPQTYETVSSLSKSMISLRNRAVLSLNDVKAPIGN